MRAARDPARSARRRRASSVRWPSARRDCCWCAAPPREARKVEGNVFFASLQTYKNRQYVVIFNELDLARRLNQITFPGVEIAYTDPAGQRQTAKLQDSTYDLFIYSNVVGGLERFTRKYN